VSPADVLLAATEAGVVLWLDGDALRFRAPAGALDGELRQRLGAARGAVVAMLRAGSCAPPSIGAWSPDLRDAFEERAAILQFDGGLAREVAEREAERLVRVEHARAFVARVALVVQPEAAAVAGERPGGGPHR
jgi:hypothetical protein